NTDLPVTVVDDNTVTLHCIRSDYADYLDTGFLPDDVHQPGHVVGPAVCGKLCAAQYDGCIVHRPEGHNLTTNTQRLMCAFTQLTLERGEAIRLAHAFIEEGKSDPVSSRK